MIFMATTKIEPEKTVGEIQSVLVKSGLVKAIQTEYECGKITGISFIVSVTGEEIPFRLPAKWQPVLKALHKDRKVARHMVNEAHARRVAWRQLLRWVEAQMAMIEIGMVDIKEVFMPYMLIVNRNLTLYEELEQRKFKMLE